MKKYLLRRQKRQKRLKEYRWQVIQLYCLLFPKARLPYKQGFDLELAAQWMQTKSVAKKLLIHYTLNEFPFLIVQLKMLVEDNEKNTLD